MPKLVISLPDAGEVIHELTEATISIGRVEENTIQIEDASVSTHHAELLESGDGYLLKDLDSTNGTAINGEPLTETKRLHPGDRVRFGKVEAIYETANHEGSRDLPLEEAAAATPASSSQRPGDFGNASPFQSKRKKKSAMDFVSMGLAVLGILAFLATASTYLFAPAAASLTAFSGLTTETLPVLRCPRRSFGVGGDGSGASSGPGVAPWPELPPFRLRENGSGGPPGVATWGKAAWTDEALHLLLVAEEGGAASSPDEAVEVFLDPVGDLEAYFAFRVGRSGLIETAVLRRSRSGFKKNLAWQCEGLGSFAGSSAPSGWFVELSIPFASIASLPVGFCWRANFFRTGPGGERSAWSPTRSGSFHAPLRFGLLELAG